MWLEKILIPNLERRSDRRYCQIGAMTQNGISKRHYEFVKAHDAKDYESFNEIDAAMRADGITLQKLGNHSMGSIAWYWTWMGMLRRIMGLERDNLYYMILIDDFHLKRPLTFYKTVVNICDRADDRQEPQIIALDCRCVTWRWAEKNSGELIERESVMPEHEVVYGIRGTGDFATILNRIGAGRLFNLMEDRADDPERHIWQLALKEDQTGLFSIRTPGYCIGHLGEGENGSDLR